MSAQFDITINDSFWRPKIDLFAREVIPYQWRVLNDMEPDAAKSHAVANFKIAAGMQEGEYYGKIFQDSDVAKWIEAAAYSLHYYDSPELRSRLEEIIGILEKAQRDDGYLNTYYTLKEPDGRFTNIADGHELYCAGHMLEAAVAYFDAVGSDRLLNILSREVDYFITVFGKNEGQLDTFPGHEEIELALTKAYERTADKKYLELAEYFINNRATVPGFTSETIFNAHKEAFRKVDYYQAHAPVREQITAEGHAVRAMYLFSGAAETARLTNNAELRRALEGIWDNMTGKRMYITGAIGSMSTGERFTVDYDLPPDRAYNETCASIGLAMWAYRMLMGKPEAKYAEVMERALYNGVLSGVSYEGRNYFYVNPLKVNPQVAKFRQDCEHVETQRVKWFGCSCCPPNVVRTTLNVGSYAYTQDNDNIWAHLYIGSEAVFKTPGGNLAISMSTDMPRKGGATLRVGGEGAALLRLRIPEYAEGFSIECNGSPLSYDEENGYAAIRVKPGDEINVRFEMKPRKIYANPRSDDMTGRLAVVYGPLVYCAEQTDNFPNLDSFEADSKAAVGSEDMDIFGGITSLLLTGRREDTDDWRDNVLYRESPQKYTDAVLRMIPYALWNNRGEGEMQVWIRYR